MCTGTAPVGLEGMSRALHSCGADWQAVPARGDTLPVSLLQTIS